MKQVLPSLAAVLVCAGAASAAQAGEFVSLELRVTSKGHELVSARRFTAPQHTAAAWNAGAGGPQLDWQLLDTEGQVLSQGHVGDPRVIRGLLEPGKGHATIVRPSADYVLRVPVDARAADLRLAPLAKAASTTVGGPRIQQAASETPGVPAQRIDVRGVMQPAR